MILKCRFFLKVYSEKSPAHLILAVPILPSSLLISQLSSISKIITLVSESSCARVLYKGTNTLWGFLGGKERELPIFYLVFGLDKSYLLGTLVLCDRCCKYHLQAVLILSLVSHLLTFKKMFLAIYRAFF